MEPQRSPKPLCAATLGGVLAIAASVAGFVSQVVNAGPLSNPSGLSLLLVLGAGAATLARPRDVRVVTAAAVLVAISMIAELFGKLGPLYLPALVLLVLGIERSEDVPRRTRL